VNPLIPKLKNFADIMPLFEMGFSGKTVSLSIEFFYHSKELFVNIGMSHAGFEPMGPSDP
jgi:hypothetical protein